MGKQQRWAFVFATVVLVAGAAPALAQRLATAGGRVRIRERARRARRPRQRLLKASRLFRPRSALRGAGEPLRPSDSWITLGKRRFVDERAQHGNQLAVFVLEEVLNQFGRGQGLLISLISTLDPGDQARSQRRVRRKRHQPPRRIHVLPNTLSHGVSAEVRSHGT